MGRRNSKPSSIESLPTVKYWLGQLAGSGITHDVGPRQDGTRGTYLRRLIEFNEWLSGREFDIRVQAFRDKKMVRENVQKSFSNVEELLHFGQDGYAMDVKKIVAQFLVDPCNQHLASKTRRGIGSAIKSYFNEQDVEFHLKSSNFRRDATEVIDQRALTMPEFYKMMTVKHLTPMMRAVMLVMLHAGLDSSTLADRFNYQAYKQIIKWCGTENHREWDLDKCPIPIKLIRVKTKFQHTTFIDRDALEAVKDYLARREEHHGPHDPDGPMFLSQRNNPVALYDIKGTFYACAKEARVQKKLALHMNKITPHEVRDTLKSLLLLAGCAQWAAEHVIGHTPHSSYDKPADQSPKKLRAEYSKVSKTLNVFSYVEDMMKNIEDPDAARGRERELEEGIKKLEEDVKKSEEKYKKTFEDYRNSNLKRNEIRVSNIELSRENRRLEMEILELKTERVDLKRKLSKLEEQNADTKDTVGEIVKQAMSEEFKKRDGKNPPA